MKNQADIVFENKIIDEFEKRKEIVEKANAVIQSIENHYQDKKDSMASVKLERKKLIDEIHSVAKEKDISKLDALFERLR